MPARKALCAALAVVAIGGFGACSSDPQKKETAGEYASDTGLTAKVKTAIATDVGARTAAGVNVETYKGTVQLSGFASSDNERARAVQIARSVPDVVDVRNDVIVRPPQ